MPPLPWQGTCRCGRVTFEVRAKPLLSMACHCTGCQRMTASAFSLSAAFPSDSFGVVEGETVIGGIHGPGGEHHHCDWCKSWLFTRPTGMDWFVNVRTTMFAPEVAAALPPFVETSTSEKLPWATTPAEHSFEHIPDAEAFAPLVEEYRQRHA